MIKTPRNMAASVRQRLANRARERGETFDIVLTRYALERLLFRLGQSGHRDRFILKGAMLFSLWTDAPYRETRDLDLLGFGPNDVRDLEEVFRSLCTLSVADDGVLFDAASVQAEPMREDQEYAGGRVRLTAMIAGARLSLQIDIGFGDAVTPAPEEITYPTLLPFPAPRIRAYPKETVVAEKYQALVSLGMANSRMKDFYDLWVMSTTFAFDGATLAAAIGATFSRRQTALPAEIPLAMTAAFAEDRQKGVQWSSFVRRASPSATPPSLPEVIGVLKAFLLPVSEALQQAQPFLTRWTPGEEGWRRA